MGRKINDGDFTGIKQDKFRNSRFEMENNQQNNAKYGGMARKTPNTIGGPYAENRGRRSAESSRSRWDSSPFENGRSHNWKRREGWDQYYNHAYDRSNRAYGGGQLDHEGSHFGKGPRGYKRSDESIFEDVCHSLELSLYVDASDIDVSVKEGIVYLNGTVSDRQIKRMAELEIENISGVMDVQNRLGLESKNGGLH